MSGHQPKPDECDFCRWKTDNLTEVDCYARTPGHGPFTPEDEKEWGWLCQICRSTPAGSAYRYPRSYPDARVLETVAWGINRILAAHDDAKRMLLKLTEDQP